MRVAVVGSGPAGVAAAQALLGGGLAVDLLDFGNEIDSAAEDLASKLRRGNSSAEDLARLRLACAPRGIGYTVENLVNFLRGRTSTLDLMKKTRLGSQFTMRDVEWGIPLEGPKVARSLAKGGLSNIWGAACYPLAEEDYAGWPVKEEEMAAHYRVIAQMVSLTEQEDDLAAAYPIYGRKSEGLSLNPLAAALLGHWRKNHDRLVEQGILLGRSRLAVRTGETSDGQGCQLCGLCLYGCPYDAIYRADWTLSSLCQNPSFRYIRSLWVQKFREKGGKVLIDVGDTREKQFKQVEYDALFLAAGTISSLRIVADAQGHYGRPVRVFDNDMYLVPFLETARNGGPSAPPHFSLSELVLRMRIWGYPIHAQLYCLNEQIIDQFRPLLSALPNSLYRWANGQLGRFFLAFIYLPGNVSAHMKAMVRPGAPVATVSLDQSRRAESRQIVRQLIRHLGRFRTALGLTPVGPILRFTPAGPGGAHPVGALPMKSEPGPMETYPDGRLYGTERVYVVDGAALTSLPAQNSTYPIMANAHRIGTLFAERQRNGLVIGSASSPPMTPAEARFGRSWVRSGVLTHDHHQRQYQASALATAYHRLVLRRAVQMGRLRPGMHVLDYGCGHQQMRRALPPGVKYTGYDAVPKLSDVEDPRGKTYDLVFAIQVLMYLDESGLSEWTETFAEATKYLVVMVPARNFLKDEILDRVFNLKGPRDQMVRSVPSAIYKQLSRRFTLLASEDPLWIGEITRWERK